MIDELIKTGEELNDIEYNIRQLKELYTNEEKCINKIEKYQDELFSLINFIVENKLHTYGIKRRYKDTDIQVSITCHSFSNKLLSEPFYLNYKIDEDSISIEVKDNGQIEKTKKFPIKMIGVNSFNFIDSCNNFFNRTLLISLFKKDMEDLSTLKNLLIKDNLDEIKNIRTFQDEGYLDDYKTSLEYLTKLDKKVEDYKKGI